MPSTVPKCSSGAYFLGEGSVSPNWGTACLQHDLHCKVSYSWLCSSAVNSPTPVCLPVSSFGEQLGQVAHNGMRLPHRQGAIHQARNQACHRAMALKEANDGKDPVKHLACSCQLGPPRVGFSRRYSSCKTLGHRSVMQASWHQVPLEAIF